MQTSAARPGVLRASLVGLQPERLRDAGERPDGGAVGQDEHVRRLDQPPRPLYSNGLHLVLGITQAGGIGQPDRDPT